MSDSFEGLSAIAAARDLSALAGQLGEDHPSPFSGIADYDALFDELSRALTGSLPRHVLLVGEKGVGQNSVLLELARRSHQNSSMLANKAYVSLDCRYIASDERRARLDGILAAIAEDPSIIACVEGLAVLLRGENGQDNSSRLWWGLSSIAGRIVGLVSPPEYREHFANSAQAAEFFRVVHMEEPSAEMAERLLSHYVRGLSEDFRVDIREAAVRESIRLGHLYAKSERLPFKALGLLHRVCEDIRYDRVNHLSEHNEITPEDLTKRVALESGVPLSVISGVGDGADYRAALNCDIFGQDHVVGEGAKELRLIKSGFADPGKPASVMMFVGQTGTGKTELAKAMARIYSQSKTIKTYTLGNFVEPHSVSGIIGVPPGYVGHDQGGRLINELRADPYGVFLLDEADKAHPDVLQPFLNLFDEGWITDQRGVKAYADHAIFILTTNVGQRQIAEMFGQGKSIEEVTEKTKVSLARIRHSKSDRPVFSPEFLARIGRFLLFKPLDREAMYAIVLKRVQNMCKDWQKRRQKALRIDDAIVDYIADRAHDLNERSSGQEGGRIVRKLFSDLIESPIQLRIERDAEAYKRCNAVVVTDETDIAVRFE